MATTPEGRIEQRLKKRARAAGMLCLKFVSPGQVGVPDRIVIGGGRVVFAELKAPGKKPRRSQEVVIDRMRRAGADIRVIDSVEGADGLIAELASAQKGTTRP